MNTRKQIDDGGTAFPIPYGQVMSDEGRGMTLRDWFAGQALAHIGSDYQARGDIDIHAESHSMNIAMHAYSFADAMLAARNQTKP